MSEYEKHNPEQDSLFTGKYADDNMGTEEICLRRAGPGENDCHFHKAGGTIMHIEKDNRGE